MCVWVVCVVCLWVRASKEQWRVARSVVKERESKTEGTKCRLCIRLSQEHIVLPHLKSPFAAQCTHGGWEESYIRSACVQCAAEYSRSHRQPEHSSRIRHTHFSYTVLLYWGRFFILILQDTQSKWNDCTRPGYCRRRHHCKTNFNQTALFVQRKTRERERERTSKSAWNTSLFVRPNCPKLNFVSAQTV
jgi:hypothetical protein